MGEHELQEALRSKARERIREIWRAAEETVAARRAEFEARDRVSREAAEAQATATMAAVRRRVLADVDLTVRRQILAAEAALEARLRALALGMLPEFARHDRDRLWCRLAAELPSAEWRRIRVHPDDLAVARQQFPAADVTGDASLGGGLVAETDDGRIVIDNSLDGRLRRAWPTLSVRLLAAVNEEVDKDAAGSPATG